MSWIRPLGLAAFLAFGGALFAAAVPATPVQEETVCSKCGKAGKEGQNYCTECGGAMQKKAAGKCVECGEGLSADQPYCPTCGAKRKTTKKKAPKCANCGTQGKAGEKACANCGEAFPEEKAPAIPLKQAVLTPAAVALLPHSSANVCLQAVYFASVKGGRGQRIVTTGTIKEIDAVKKEYSYSEEPSDRLRVEFANGGAIEFVVEALEGDLSGDLFNFHSRPHDFRFQASTPDVGSIRYAFQRTKTGAYTSAYTITMKGKGRIQEQTGSVDIKITGSGYSEGDGSGVESRDEYLVEGRIRLPGLDMQVKERHNVQSVYARGTNGASTSTRVMDDTWTLDGVEYRMTGSIHRSFQRGNIPIDVESVWRADGQLLRNGKKYGILGIGQENRARKVRISLETQDEKITFETWES